MGDKKQVRKKVYNHKSPHNLDIMGYELIKVAYNDMNPDDIIHSRQRVEQICKNAQLKVAQALSNDPFLRDVMMETVEAPKLNDHQRMMMRIVGLSEGMDESDQEMEESND